MPATLVSLTPFEIREEYPTVIPKVILIPAANPGDFNILHIEDVTTRRDLGNGDSIDLPLDDLRHAKAICNGLTGSFMATDPENHPGVFAVPGKLSKDEVKKQYPSELKSAEKAQIGWFTKLVELGDSDWARIQDPRVITNLQKRAANYLKLDKEWARELDLTKRKFCPACQTEVSPVAVICKTCGCVIDPEAAKKMQFVKV